MKVPSSRRVEEALRNGSAGARRDPSPALRSRITAALESEATGAGRAGEDSSARASTAAPLRRFVAGRRARLLAAAAVAVIAIGLWKAAIVRTPSVTIRSNPIDESTSPEALARFARATPGTVRAAIDDSLFAELGHIATDAQRAARFLVGRVPDTFVARSADDESR